MTYKDIALKLILVSLLSPVMLFGDTGAFTCVKEITSAEGKSALSNLQSKYGEVKTLSARFAQYSHLAALNTSELSQGTLVFSKPGKMKWVYNDPEPQEFTADGETLWFYQPEDNQVMVDNFKSSFRGDLPVSFLIGIGDISRDFDLVGSCRTKEAILLNLSPKNTTDEEIGKIGLLVDPASFLPIGAELFDPAGNKNSFIFSELDTSKSYVETYFQPSFPKGTDIIDNRKG